MIILAVVSTIVAGIVGGAIGSSFMNYPDMGLIVAIAVMGGFIMAGIKRHSK